MTRTRKTLLLASMALVALAFAVPASASAYTSWSYKGKVIKSGTTLPINQSYVGHAKYKASWGYYDCNTTVEIEVTGPTAGRISKLERDPSSCTGTGIYTGCTLTEQTDNIANIWNIDIAASPLQVTTPGTTLKTTWFYKPACNAGTHTSVEFDSLNMSPTLDGNGQITSFLLYGPDSSDFLYHEWGPFTPTTPALGLSNK